MLKIQVHRLQDTETDKTSQEPKGWGMSHEASNKAKQLRHQRPNEAFHVKPGHVFNFGPFRISCGFLAPIPMPRLEPPFPTPLLQALVAEPAYSMQGAERCPRLCPAQRPRCRPPCCWSPAPSPTNESDARMPHGFPWGTRPKSKQRTCPFLADSFPSTCPSGDPCAGSIFVFGGTCSNV